MDRHAACISGVDKSIASFASSYQQWLQFLSRSTLYINDSVVVDSQVQQLLGSGSIAVAKSQAGRRLEFQGWTFDLDAKTIT